MYMYILICSYYTCTLYSIFDTTCICKCTFKCTLYMYVLIHPYSLFSLLYIDTLEIDHFVVSI